MTEELRTQDAPEEGAGDRGTDRDPVDLGRGTPLAEWVMAAVGAVIAAAVIAQLVVSGLSRDDHPAQFHLEVTDVVALDASYLAQVDVRNVGGSPAATVEVEARLTLDDGTRQQAHAELEYLPAGATRAVGLIFDDDPAQGSLTAAVVGFRVP